MPKYIITIAGEVLLKSPRTRPRFIKKLLSNIQDAFKRNNVRDYKISVEGARIFIESKPDVSDLLKNIFGIYRFGEVVKVDFKDLKDLAIKISELAKHMVKDKKFAVRVHRVGEHDFTSIDVAREVGALLKPYSRGVDLDNPDIEVWIEVRGNKAYLYKSRIKGPGGLPIGVEGRVLVLFSGGFDSPVAAWFMAKRGAIVDLLHYIMGSPQLLYMVHRVAKVLADKWLYGYSPRMYIVDLREIINVIRENVKRSYRQVVLRAIMYIVADKVARKYGYDAIATGESLGQASSQTLVNLSVIEKAINIDTMILRPLIGLDKEDIINYSRLISTYEESSKVAECCTIAPTLVVTRAKLSELKEELEKIPKELIESAIKNIQIINILSTRVEELMPKNQIEIDFIPEGAIVVDLRSIDEYKKWHYPGALHVSMIDSYEKYKDKPIVFYCQFGHISYLMAYKLRSQGYKAFSLKGGIKTAKELSSSK